MEGEMKGKIEGKIEEKIEIAQKAIEMGMPIEDVSKLTSLSEKHIKELIKK
jgi:predicted transposase/invertase (TIGR01784 family)